MDQTNIKVSELVDKVERGELTLPEMQRRYVWPATRVRDLLDSLYRGYPSGTILMWETDEEMPVRELTYEALLTYETLPCRLGWPSARTVLVEFTSTWF